MIENFHVQKLIQKSKYLLKVFLWVLNGYFGKPLSLESPEKLTVLITYFNPVRMKNINHQIRNILKCRFVERIIISNHNPDVNIQKRIKIENRRLTLLNQDVKRGCGFRWQVASVYDPEYLVVVDDDFLIYPGQLTTLFKYLLAEPEILHGLSGMNYLPDGTYEFRDRENRDVDFLCEIYALTHIQLSRYQEIYKEISPDEQLARSVDSTSDFMIISKTGISKPKIHDVGRLVRDETFKQEGIAVHKDGMFNEHVQQIQEFIRNRDLGKPSLAE
jgi:hypothetical protein